MSVAGMPKWSLRLEQAESSRLAWAFALSVALHLLVFGAYESNRKFGWSQYVHWPAWLQPVHRLVDLLKTRKTIPPPSREAPLLFVDVNPALATAEPPPDSRFYSDKNSRAANPDADKDTGIPKITGTQKDVPRTEDIPRQKFSQLQPSPPAQPQEPQEELKPKPTQAPGDLAMAKPDLTPRKDSGEAEHSRPRTLKEALARLQPDDRLAGQKMKQEGGVKRHYLEPGFDARATPFGAYDRALILAVEQRWFALLDQRDYASDARGRVVVQFQLHYDGKVTDVSIAENTAGEVLGLLCQKAVQDPAPFGTWPSDMRRLAGDTRYIQFTFYYN